MNNPLRHYNNLIAEVDALLDLVRLLWQEAPSNSAERMQYRGRLDQLLDERLRLMNLRDLLDSKAA